MQAHFNKINSLIKTMQGLLPMKKEDKARLDKKIRLEFNYNSNHIEGNTLTYGETELLLIFDKTTGNHELREYEEMKAHDVVFELIKNWALDKERTLSEIEIKNLHQTLLVRPFWKEAITTDRQPTRRLIKVGSYKEYPNHVRLQNGEMFLYASVEDTPILMGELVEWYRKEEGKKELHPVALAALLHYKFVRIHPFDDGNGRLSRLLMNYVLLKHDLPSVIIKSAGKKEYLFALNQADTGDMDSFVEYVGEQMIWSLELSTKAAKGEEVKDFEDIDKEITLLKKSLKTKQQLSDKRTSLTVRMALLENILPLMIMIEKKCNDLKELFFDYNRIVTYQNLYDQHYLVLGSTESKLSDLIKGFSDRIEDDKIITQFKYSFELKGLKSSINANNVWISIDFFFEIYNYQMRNNYRSGNTTYPYGKEVDMEELQQIVSTIMNAVILEINDSK